MNDFLNTRVLVIDDNRAIHDDIRKILAAPSAAAVAAADASLDADEDAIFGTGPSASRNAASAIADALPTASFEVDSSYQGQDGFARVEQARREGRPYAVAFVDMRMPPGWDGLRTIREIWRCDPDVNIVICTAFSDRSWTDIESVAGPGDRLLVLKKPFEPIEVRRLAATLTAKWTLSRQAAVKMAELGDLVDSRTRELHLAATHDRLTGLPNRALLYDRLNRAIASARRSPLPDGGLAALFLDFDRFKIVNDSLGHASGDQLLQQIAGRLTGALRETDTVALADGLTARLGGDEFCVLLTNLRNGVADAAHVAQRLLGTLAAPYDLSGNQVQSTASIGIAMFAPGYENADELIRDADTAMYRAKSEGKARFVVFDAAMHEQAVRRLQLEAELRRAIAGGELETYYQPVVSLETGRVTGAEALVRWNHPTRGVVSPGDFISVAEESNLICDLGLIVLEQAARQQAAWRAAFPAANLSVSVNVSPKQLASPGFVADVADVLARTGADAGRLSLEITETALVRNSEVAGTALRSLRGLGLKMLLDDFGTGYSSLSLLHAFRFDGLKIDQSFVREAGHRREFAAIVHAVSELAFNLRMDVVAEGVETREQLAFLQSLRCDRAQGYLFSRPVPAAAFEQLLGAATPAWLAAPSIAA